MTVISLLSGKGGCGKSTVSVHLAHWLHANKQSVILVDADAQRSSSTWIAEIAAPKIPYLAVPKAEDLLDELPRLEQEYDVVLTDAPGSLAEVTRAIALRSSLCLIPVQPSSLDVDAAAETVRAVMQARDIRGGFPCACLFLSRAVKGTRLEQEARELLTRYPLPLLDTTIWQRQVIADAPGQACTVWELGGKSSHEAGRDFDRLFEEALQCLE